MLVEDLMTHNVEACGPDASLAEAAAVMWRRDCGVVPVVGEGDRPVGVITDRDICMALATRRAYASDVRVSEVMSRDVATCLHVDDVREALEVMREHQFNRLPVVNGEGRLVGILSVGDVVRRTRKGKGKRRVSRKDTLATLRAIRRPRAGEGSAAEDDEEDDEATVEDEAGGDAA